MSQDLHDFHSKLDTFQIKVDLLLKSKEPPSKEVMIFLFKKIKFKKILMQDVSSKNTHALQMGTKFLFFDKSNIFRFIPR